MISSQMRVFLVPMNCYRMYHKKAKNQLVAIDWVQSLMDDLNSTIGLVVLLVLSCIMSE